MYCAAKHVIVTAIFNSKQAKVMIRKTGSKTKRVKIIYTLKPKHFSKNLEISNESFQSLLKKVTKIDHDAFVAENFGVGDNVWKQIMLIVFKAVNIFWRKCFVTNEYHTLNVCSFQKHPGRWTEHCWTKQGHVTHYGWNMHRQQWSERSKHIRSNWAFYLKTFTQVHESMQHSND